MFSAESEKHVSLDNVDVNNIQVLYTSFNSSELTAYILVVSRSISNGGQLFHPSWGNH